MRRETRPVRRDETKHDKTRSSPSFQNLSAGYHIHAKFMANSTTSSIFVFLSIPLATLQW